MSALGHPRFVYESISSTMDRLADLAAEGSPEGTVVVAREQTAGRGRAGRVWIAPPGTSLLMSVLLRPNMPASALGPLPLIAGLATAEGIESLLDPGFTSSIRLKWPNDLYLGGGKIGGILMQSRSAAGLVEFVNLGIGINVNLDADSLPAGALSLSVESGTTWSLDVIEQAILKRLSNRYRGFCGTENTEWLAEWHDRALYLGENVRIDDHGMSAEGKFIGVTSSGALLLETAEGRQEIVAGDLVRGPRPA